MLVYANYVPVRSSRGLAEPLEPVAEWLSRKLKRRIETRTLLEGRELRGRDGWQIHALATVDQYPHFASIALVHPDADVSGRRWHSEIGLRQQSPAADVDLTVLVQTSEISTRVTAPVSPGAPTFVTEILQRCHLSSGAIGGETRALDDEDAEAFRYVVLDKTREYPLVVVSPTRDGKYLVDSGLLAQLLIGIAELVVIPANADTFWLARSVGADFVPYLGAARIIYPFGTLGRATVRTFAPEEIAAAALNPAEAARELFSLVLHRTNLPLSWKHVSPVRVKDERLRRELARRRAEATITGDAAQYTRFMEEYVKEQEAVVQETLLEKKRLEEALVASQRLADDVHRDQRSKIDGLKLQLESAKSRTGENPHIVEDALSVAEAVASAIKHEPTPEDCLTLLEHFFSTRIVILPEAWTSARESAGFRYGQKLYALLHALVTTYWSDLSAGTPDQEARKVFGSAYAAKESEGVANNRGARRKRTFRYCGEDYVMVKHLKIGVKDSPAESIRVHFEWLSESKRIVVGHCGPHIPFS